MANFGNRTIERFTPGGAASDVRQLRPSRPIGLAFDGAGNLYVANSGDSTIERFTAGGAASVFASGSGLSGPFFLAFEVPEPSTWALLGVGAGALGWTVRRQRPPGSRAGGGRLRAG